jgi:transcriptional regulator with XRE-family HTH domain
LIGLLHHQGVDDAKVGNVLRAVRIRRGLRQSDVAEEAGVSPSLVSILERGGLEELSLRSIRRVASSLGVRLPFEPRWRGADLARLADERHAAIVRAVVARLVAMGWSAEAEITFSIGGESGSIDVLGWKAEHRAMLLVEAKSEIADLQGTLSAFDRKRRLASTIARDRGLRPQLMAAVFALPEETQARNAVSRYRQIFDQTYPSGSHDIRRWLRRPERDLRGIWFLPISNTSTAKRRRVRLRSSRRQRPDPSARLPSVKPASD